MISQTIMDHLEKNQGKHYTIKEIQEIVKCDNKATVWRNLKTIIKYPDFCVIFKIGDNNRITSYYGVRVRGVNENGRTNE